MEFTQKEIRTMRAAARSLNHTYGINQDDLFQEFAQWMVRREDKVEEFRHGKAGLYTTLARMGVRYCRKELAAINGGGFPQDRARYGLDELRELLTQSLEHDRGELQGVAYDDVQTSGQDPALGGTRLAAIADVRSAIKRIDEKQAAVLLTAADLGWDYDLLGLGLQDEGGNPIKGKAARDRCDNYLKNLQKELNTDGVREVKSDDDARNFYSRQLKGMEDYVGDRDPEYVDEDAELAENYYRSHGAGWDNY